MRVLKRIGLLLWFKVFDIANIILLLIIIGLLEMGIQNSRWDNLWWLILLLIIVLRIWCIYDWKEVKRRIK